MRRRDFLAAAGAALAMWPGEARAQRDRLARIGVLAPNGLTTFGPLREALAQRGYQEGVNITFDIRDAGGRLDNLDILASELVRRNMDVIITGTQEGVAAAQRTTSAIPIVMGGVLEPVANGFVASLTRPGGNITGVGAAPGGAEVKMLDLFRDMKPTVQRVAVLTTPAPSGPYPFVDLIVAAGEAAGLTVQPIFIGGLDELEAAFAAMASNGAEGFITTPNFVGKEMVDLALRYKLPSFAVGGVLARAGGLIGYNASLDERAHLIASYVDLILKGGKPAALPVAQPTRFDLTVNMKTARAIGFDIPLSVLVRATEVIE